MQSQPFEPTSCADANPSAPRGGPILLGLFILGQLVFLLVANLFSVVELGHGSGKEHIPPALRPLAEQVAPGKPGEDHFWTTLATINRVADIWSDVTGQPQGWSLFSNPDKFCDFPAIQLRWDEPADFYPVKQVAA